jgi:hypothetical protein
MYNIICGIDGMRILMETILMTRLINRFERGDDFVRYFFPIPDDGSLNVHRIIGAFCSIFFGES